MNQFIPESVSTSGRSPQCVRLGVPVRSNAPKTRFAAAKPSVIPCRSRRRRSVTAERCPPADSPPIANRFGTPSSAAPSPRSHSAASSQSSGPAGYGCSGASRYSTLTPHRPVFSAIASSSGSCPSAAPIVQPPPWMCRYAPVASPLGGTTRSRSPPPRDGISTQRACGRKTGGGKMPPSSIREARVTSGGTVSSGGSDDWSRESPR